MRVRYSFSSRKTRTMDDHNQHRREFPVVVRELINKSDIILEVLDSRFIDETRNAELENLIRSEGKMIIFVLNKSDLVDVKEKKKEVAVKNIYPYVFVSCFERRGSADLRQRIKIEIKKLNLPYKKANVGVIGYPNTGKSSVINLLAGRSVARTASESGFTKGIQKVNLSDSINIIDTPGVIPDKEDSNINQSDFIKHTKISVRTSDKVKEPDIVVHELMKQYPGVFEKFYNINAKGDSEKIIEDLGRKHKFLLPGNKVDIDRTSRLILKDWQDGKIKV